MTITTSDCKNFLISTFPQTKNSLWKRVSKYKNEDNLTVRVFQYNNGIMVGVLENNGVLSAIKENEELEKKNKNEIKFIISQNQYNKTFDIPSNKVKNGPNKFLFSICNNEQMDMMDLGSTILVAIVEYNYWLENGSMDDNSSEEPADYMPVDWQAEDVNQGGQWLLYTDLTPQEVKNKMISIGFKWQKDFDDFINQ